MSVQKDFINICTMHRQLLQPLPLPLLEYLLTKTVRKMGRVKSMQLIQKSEVNEAGVKDW